MNPAHKGVAALPERGLRPCPCGCTPTLNESEHSGILIMRLECDCGLSGATLMYTKRGQREQMIQAAWDGWNLAG